MDEVRLQKYYNAIIDKLNEMIPVKWTRILLYAEETGERRYADFYFYTEDGKLHEFVDINKEYNQSYRTPHDHMEKLREINKELWLEFVSTGEPKWCTYSMDLTSNRKFRIKYGYELYDAYGVGERVVRWAYEEHGIIPKSIVDKRTLRKWLAKQDRPIPDELYSREKIIYIKPDGGIYKRNEIAVYEEQIDKYNKIFHRENCQVQDFVSAVENIIIIAKNNNTNVFLQAMVILLLAYENRNNYRGGWTASAHASLEWGDKEICRELVIYAIKQSCKSDVNNSSYEFIPLSKETKDDHVADIIGMVIEELSMAGDLSEEQYDKILTAFAKPVQLWRCLEVPKARQQGSYDLLYQIMELCCEHKAYISALRLAGVLYIADTTKNWEQLAKTMLLTGKIAYELGFLEVAKHCFLFSDKDTNGECFNGVEEKYKALLQQETKLEITDEICEMQRNIDEIFAKEDAILYSKDEYMDILDGKIKIPPYNLTGSSLYHAEEKVAKARKKLSDKAMKQYKEYADGTPKERRIGIKKAFDLFKEEPEVYECAAQLYVQKANLCLDENNKDNENKEDSENNVEAAYEYFRKAYHCKEGKYNGSVLLGIAITLSKMGRMAEAATYFFRAYILCGKDFILEKASEEA